MANTIKLRRSAVQGAVPTPAQLQLGEVAINTYDGKLFIKKNDGTESVVEIGAGGGGTLSVPDGGTGATNFTSGRLLVGQGTSAITSSLIADNGTTVTINGSTVITGGSINGTSVGATTASSGAFTTLSAINAFTTGSSVSFNSLTASINLGGNHTTGVFSIGGAAGTGILTLGRSTASQTTNIQAGATASGSTKTINFGTGGLAGSNTNINIGSIDGTSITNLNGAVVANGNVGIGTTPSGTYKLEVMGATYASSMALGTSLPVGSGGTGATTLTANNVILGNGTSAVQFVAPGTSGNVLTSDGTTWTSAAAGASLTGVTQSVTPFETALGFEAGLNTTGINNTFVGYRAGKANTTGANNVAFGYESALNLTTGENRVAIGSGAMRTATIDPVGGSGDVAIGYNALYSIFTSGYYNTAVGYQAGYSTNEEGITAIGWQAARLANTYRVTAIGMHAAGALTSGHQTTVVGARALLNATAAPQNTVVGADAGRSVTTGTQNSLFGMNAGFSGTNDLTTGSNNIILGYNAAASSATVSNEITIGNSSITSLRIPGLQSGKSINDVLTLVYDSTDGVEKLVLAPPTSPHTGATLSATTRFGQRAGTFDTNSPGGTYVGADAGKSNTGSNVTAIGRSSLVANTTGANNTGLGYFSGQSVTTGQQNTLLGTNAGASGTNNLTTGSNNILIGYNAAASSATISNETTIGNSSTTSARIFGDLKFNNSYTEKVFTITDGATVNLDPNNGSIQTWTLGASRTPGQANWNDGQSITLMIDDGSAFTVTWTTLGVVWETNGGSAPTLATTGFTVIVLWKVGTTIYGARVGDA